MKWVSTFGSRVLPYRGTGLGRITLHRLQTMTDMSNEVSTKTKAYVTVSQKPSNLRQILEVAERALDHSWNSRLQSNPTDGCVFLVSNWFFFKDERNGEMFVLSATFWKQFRHQLTSKKFHEFHILQVKWFLLHPETIVEGCLYLNVNGLLWSESVMGYYGVWMLGYYGRMVYGSYDHVPI